MILLPFLGILPSRVSEVAFMIKGLALNPSVDFYCFCSFQWKVICLGFRCGEELRTTNLGIHPWYNCILLYSFFEIHSFFFSWKAIFSITLVCVCKSSCPENIKRVDSKVLENFAKSLSFHCLPLSGAWIWSCSMKRAWGDYTCLQPSSYSALPGNNYWKHNPYHTQIHNCFGE